MKTFHKILFAVIRYEVGSKVFVYHGNSCNINWITLTINWIAGKQLFYENWPQINIMQVFTECQPWKSAKKLLQFASECLTRRWHSSIECISILPLVVCCAGTGASLTPLDSGLSPLLWHRAGRHIRDSPANASNPNNLNNWEALLWIWCQPPFLSALNI